ncbi:hypothetical protein FIBSPDRAFT_841261, partial [Athelia psychrophila]
MVRIEIRSAAHNSSESLSVVRVEISLQNLLEKCADGDAAVLGLAIAPLVSGVVDPAAGTGGHMDSKHSAPNSIDRMSIKLCWLSHEPHNLLQLPSICAVSTPQISQLEGSITEEVGEDLDILSFEQALALTPDGHPNKPARLSNLASSYLTRFERLGDLADLQNLILSYQQAVALTPDGHPDKPGRLSYLADGHLACFERLGDLADLENSIASNQQAVALTPDGHPDKPTYLSNLGT